MHFQRELGVFVQLRDTGRILADADGQGWVDILRHADRPDSVQNGELFVYKMLKILFFKQEQVMVPIRFQQDALACVGQVCNFSSICARTALRWVSSQAFIRSS